MRAARVFVERADLQKAISRFMNENFTCKDIMNGDGGCDEVFWGRINDGTNDGTNEAK